jgi:hypothetical protein
VDEEEDAEMLDGLAKDSDGSAKIALIAMDRSLAAWAVVKDLLPQHEQAAGEFLRILDQLRRNFEGHFPNARNFVRPGFDE